MKKLVVLMAVLAVMCVGSVAKAANVVSITGDATRDGYLTIDIDWTIDSANYKGSSPEEIRKLVYEDIWKTTLPKLVKATEGYPVSFEKGKFHKLSENKLVALNRPDGTKVTNYKASVRFDCPKGDGSKPMSAKQKQEAFDKEYHYHFVREGSD